MDETPPFPKSVNLSAVRKVEIPLDEMVAVYRLLEDLNQFLHQPDNFTRENIEAFLVEQGGYKRLNHAYYKVVWDWLPPDVKETLLSR